MKTYEFVEESWYASIGCDCCEPVLMECYNILGDYYTNGSAHSIEDCYEQALILEGIIDEDLDFDYDEVDFELLCQAYGIKVIIHREEDVDFHEDYLKYKPALYDLYGHFLDEED